MEPLNSEVLLKQEWRPVGTGKSYGSGGMVDPKTGWAYTVDIEWKQGTELTFGITNEHYKQMEALCEATEECWCRAEDLPDFLRNMVN
ncbi:hypothetical protein [Vibrio coralliilyticus]|uniref:Uncharacterized protein n=1 Tax=Vibrio coralliilyticus TaxID=190893 RepID=A0AAP6ZNE2_9VIBR|nr:hypothetical protein [Vibrio coralliilyticus]NOI31803.1 hypothetical protein [Vibrio coralliilyticus]NOJ25246.1 hypothetical protein [Vibrio coralliilyticus]